MSNESLPSFADLQKHDLLEDAKRAEIDDVKKNKRGQYNVRQVAAGIADMGNLPALYTLPGVIGDLMDKDWKLPGHEKAAELSESYNSAVNEFYGVDNPEGIGENVSRLASLLTPTGSVNAATRLPKLAQLVKAPKVVEKVAAGIGHATDALVVPGVQGNYTKTKAAANIGIPFAAQQGISETIEDPNNPEQTVLDYAPGVKQTLPTQALPSFEELQKHDLDKDEAQNGYMSSTNTALATVALLAGLGHAAKTGILKNLEQRSLPKTLSQTRPNENTATVTEKLASNVIDQNIATTSQARKVLPEVEADLIEANFRLNSANQSVQNHANNVFRTGNFPMPFGRGDQIQVKVQPLQDQLNVLDQMEPLKKQQVDDVLMAMDELDTWKLGRDEFIKNNPGKAIPTNSILKKPDGTPFNVKELQDVINDGIRDPQIKMLVNMLQEQPKALLRFGKQFGLYNDEQIRELSKAHPNYMPRVQVSEKGISDVLLGPKDNADAIDAVLGGTLGKRNLDLATRGDEFAGTFAPPTTVLQGQQSNIIRAAMVNQTRREVFDKMRNLDGSYKLKGMRDVAEGGEKTIKYLENGKLKHVYVPDDAMRNALMFAPRRLHGFEGIAATLRQVKEFMTTGPIAAPFFQVVSGQMWEPVWQALTLPKGYTMGGALAPFAGAIGLIKGMKGHYSARMADHFRQQLLNEQFGFAKAGRAAGMSTQEIQALADAHAKAYAESAVYLMRMNAATGTHVWKDFEQLGKTAEAAKLVKDNIAKKILEKIAPDKKLNPYGNEAKIPSWFSHYFNALIDSIHNGVKYQITDLNAPKHKGGSSYAEDYLNDLALLSRDMKRSLDSTRRGSGTVANAVTNIFPYANVTIQGFHRLYRAAKENPKRFWTGMTSIASMGAANAYLNSRDDSQREWYWYTLTPEDRAGKVWIPGYMLGGQPEDSVPLPLDPAVAYVHMLGSQLANASFGMSSDKMSPDIKKHLDEYFSMEDRYGLTGSERASADVAAGGHRAVALGTPPIGELFTTTRGGSIKPDGSIGEQRGQGAQEYNPNTNGENSRYMHGIISSRMEAILGSMFNRSVVGMLTDTLEGYNMHTRTGKPGALADGLGEAANQFKIDYVDKAAPWLPGTQRVGVKTYTTEARELGEYREALSKLDARANDISRGGMTKKDASGVELMGAKPDAASPQEAEMVLMINKRVDGLKKLFVSSRDGLSNLYKQRDSINADPTKSQAQRKLINDQLNKKIQATEREYLAALQVLESEVGQQIGQPDFDLKEFVNGKFAVDIQE